MRATAADIRYPRGLAPQASPLRTPVFRVLSRNDPIIPYEQCVAFAAQPTVGCANPPFATPSPTALAIARCCCKCLTLRLCAQVCG